MAIDTELIPRVAESNAAGEKEKDLAKGSITENGEGARVESGVIADPAGVETLAEDRNGERPIRPDELAEQVGTIDRDPARTERIPADGHVDEQRVAAVVMTGPAASASAAATMAAAMANDPKGRDPTLIRPMQLFFGFGFLVLCFLLLMMGHDVNSSWTRKVVANFIHTKVSPLEVAAQPAAVTAAPVNSATQVLSLTVKLGENVLETRNLEVPGPEVPAAATVAAAAPPTDALNVLKALVVAVLAWTWTNLVLLAAFASATASCFCRPVEKVSDLATEVGWSMVNGLFVVSILACSQVFLGDSLDKSLGISTAMKVNLLQENYMRLACFSILLGIFVGLAESRVNSIPGRLPYIGKIFKAA